MVALLIILVAIGLTTTLLVPLAQGNAVTWSSFVSTYDWLVAVVLVVLVLALVAWGMRQTFPQRGARVHRRARRQDREGSAPNDPAASIARERFARGEISSDQLDQILRELGRGPRGA